MTHVVAHLSDHLHQEKSPDAEVTTGYELWSWFPLSGWKATILRLFALVFIFLLILVIAGCCFVPCEIFDFLRGILCCGSLCADT